MPVYKTISSTETKKIAAVLAKKILRARIKRKNALTFALTGDLGSGKTTFVQGFLRGLSVRRRIISPTFVITKNYKLKTKSHQTVYHIDCYRIKKASELLKLGLKEILENPQNIVLIEWAEKIRRVLPKNVIWLKFEHGDKMNERIVKAIRN